MGRKMCVIENIYIINASRYLEKAPEIKDGVELSSIVKSITRGAQVKASYLDENRSSEPTPYIGYRKYVYSRNR